GMLVKEYRPDMLVLDVMLPDINGKEVCQRVRADSTMEEVRILCISGMIEEDKIQDLRLAGADDFMHKPFDAEQLIDRMCKMLEMVLAHQAHFHLGFVDWNQPGPHRVHRVCYKQAILAHQLAQQVGCDQQRSWIAGFLAPLGWLALSALAPSKIADSLELLDKN